jgi:fibronectin-binding autotransporter adhesin
VVSNNSTYSGGTTIDAGILEPLDFHSLGPGSVMVNAGGTLLINTGVEPIQIGPLSGSGTVNLLADNGLAVNLASGVSSTFSGTLEGTPASNLSGSPLFILNGSGTLHLDGATTLLGVIMVVGGILDLDSSTALSNNTFLRVAAGAQIVVNGVNLSTAGLLASTSGPDGSIALNGGSLTVEPSAAAKGANLNFAGNISGTGGFGIDAPGTSQTLSGNNTYSGPTTITAGSLVAGSTTVLSPNSAFVINGGLALEHNNTIGSLSGSGLVTGGSGPGPAVLTVGNDGTNTTFSGTLVDGVLLGVPIGLTKIGSGTLTLSGTSNTYTGPTTINGGTLSLTGSITNSPATV